MKHLIQNKIYSNISKLIIPLALKIKSGGCGFFGDFFMALNGIQFAEKNGLKCRITWDHRSLYHDKDFGPNPWLYYFNNNQFDFSEKKRNITLAIPYFPGSQEFANYPNLNPRESICKAINNYCDIRDDITSIVEKYCHKNFMASRTLGVHLRRTDIIKNIENRASIGLDHFVNETRNWLKHNADSTIFLASDDQGAIERFKREFGECVHYRACIRSTDGRSLHGHYDEAVAGSAYQKGVEVLIDALLLAKCDYLIRTHSRVTCFSLCVNPTLEFLDLELKYLNEMRTPWLFETKF